jgi:hypothetical protein
MLGSKDFDQAFLNKKVLFSHPENISEFEICVGATLPHISQIRSFFSNGKVVTKNDQRIWALPDKK